MNEKITKSDAEWKAQLTTDQYHVCREKGTERPFSGELYHNTETGSYHCVCCGAHLFNSTEKFDSGSGWPSFCAPGDESNIETKVDLSHGMNRTEVLCKQCGAHLGHVFNDGPPPTQMRYCINSVSLNFEKK